jgi:catechol 2,3-dioxygenase-like lactoylglutathione lyase family enzyme
MSNKGEPLVPRLTVITLGVDDIKASIAFYEALGFSRKMRATGEEVAFFDTGGTTIALFAWAKAAREAGVAEQPRPAAFRGVTLAWNCRDRAEVDAVLAFALGHDAKLLKAAAPTEYGGYAGYFADPDGHVWEAVVAPGIAVGDDRRVHLPD